VSSIKGRIRAGLRFVSNIALDAVVNKKNCYLGEEGLFTGDYGFCFFAISRETRLASNGCCNNLWGTDGGQPWKSSGNAHPSKFLVAGFFKGADRIHCSAQMGACAMSASPSISMVGGWGVTLAT